MSLITRTLFGFPGFGRDLPQHHTQATTDIARYIIALIGPRGFAALPDYVYPANYLSSSHQSTTAA